jgi:uroporphyrinogen decarboxylase
MYTHPDVVHAVTTHVVDFFVAANERLFTAAGDQIDAFFFGNDFGTQLDLLISPDSFREFVFPYFKKLSTHAQGHGYQVVLHSCGSIYRVIPDLIEMGVQALHPLQAKAAHMDAGTLSREFRGKVAFVGGVDTQELLIRANPSQIKDEVARLVDLLGPALVVSPSHEAVLPNVPPENLVAMSEAVYQQ